MSWLPAQETRACGDLGWNHFTQICRRKILRDPPIIKDKCAPALRAGFVLIAANTNLLKDLHAAFAVLIVRNIEFVFEKSSVTM